MKYLGNGFTKDGRLYTLKTSKDHWGEVKRKKKTKESLAILMYQNTVFLRCKSGGSLQSSLQSKSKSQQASVQKQTNWFKNLYENSNDSR